MFSVMSVILSTWGGGAYFTGDSSLCPLYMTLALLPLCTGSQSPSQTCSHLFNLDLTVQGPPSPDIFKLVQYEACRVSKRLADILLECFLGKILTDYTGQSDPSATISQRRVKIFCTVPSLQERTPRKHASVMLQEIHDVHGQIVSSFKQAKVDYIMLDALFRPLTIFYNLAAPEISSIMNGYTHVFFCQK